ncbi:hypothetical protein DXG03_008260 [Asterophora parasitica]|uniref:Uncharacterized protein n=1 Tax=Asterophora parasitica TaxID=117018 RepID=A0A9P7KBG6_9AGAR|nr:hypothetical protein DXG03_008260 [Asterophora parasitica]
MDLRPRKLETVKEEGGHIVAGDWWHTSYDSLPWTFAQEDADGSAKRHSFRGSLFVPGASEIFPRPRRTTFDGYEHDLTLNADLCGVKCVADAISTYELDVGFSLVEVMDSLPCELGDNVDISIEVEEESIACGREKWNAYVEELTSQADDGFATVNDTSRVSSPSSSQGGLHRSTSTLSSVDLTDSDLSLTSASLPSTPRGRSAEAIVEVNDTSPVKEGKGHFVSPSRPLNASASSFIPTSIIPLKAKAQSFTFATPTPIPKPPQTAFVNFTFPSLEVPPLPTMKIEKDEQGFYSEAEVAAPVPQSQRAACAFLPPFLQDSARRKTPASKTRAMVDRLRSAHNHSHSPIPNAPLYDLNLFDERISVSEDDRARDSGLSTPSSQEEDDDGWINFDADKATQESKARRTRNLFLALTRRRSDSTPPNQETEATTDDHVDIEIPMTASPTSSPSPLPTTEDGWIEGPSLSPSTDSTPQQRQVESRSRSHRKRRSSHAPPAPPTTAPPHFMPSKTPLRAPVGLSHVPFRPSASQFPPNPASYFYATYPSMMSPVAYTSYMQQLQLMQLQMQGRRSTAPHTAEWFRHPGSGGNPLMTASTAPSPMQSTALGRHGSMW